MTRYRDDGEVQIDNSTKVQFRNAFQQLIMIAALNVGTLLFSTNSSIVGGKIAYQSNAQTRSCSRGISSLLTAAKPGAGSPVARSTTKEASAGKLWCWHHRVIRANGLAKRFGPPRFMRRARAS
jgi:hypothetical protein